jgi:KDO2-lipid IV(A) lauroyltransferase
LYWLLRIFSLILASLPASLLDACARIFAFCLFDVFRLRRRLILQNLNRAFGDTLPSPEKLRIGRASIYNFLLTTLEFLRSHRYPLDSDVVFYGREHLENALSAGGGAYVVVCHLGNFEAMATCVSKSIARVYAPVKKVGGKGSTKFVTEMREMNGFSAEVRKQKGDGIRAIIATLKANQVVGFMMDQARPGEQKLPFFGFPAKTNTSLAAIWARYPRPVIPGWCVRRGFNQHSVYFLPPVAHVQTGDAAADIIENTLLYSAAVEQMIRQQPDQYFWLHDRWKP